MSLQNTQTNLSSNQPYNTVLLAFPATGSFTLRRALPAVTMTPSTILQSVDVSGSLQLNVPVSLVSTGSIATDASGNLVVNSVTFTASTLITLLNNGQATIASVGSLENLFVHYNNYVAAYFGNTGGFSLPFSLLTTANTSSYDGNGYINGLTTRSAPFENKLTEANVVNLLTTDLSGSLTINNLTSLLTFVCSQNTFQNRTTETFTNGFKQGDLIYLSSGIAITLTTAITNNGIQKLASSSASFSIIDTSFNTLHDVSNSTAKILDYTFSSNGTSNLTLSVSVPLLLRLV